MVHKNSIQLCYTENKRQTVSVALYKQFLTEIIADSDKWKEQKFSSWVLTSSLCLTVKW